MPRDAEGPGFDYMTKILQDSNVIPIGNYNSNLILNTMMYEVEYRDD